MSRRSLLLTMNHKTKMLCVTNPGVFPGVTFVYGYDLDDLTPVTSVASPAEPAQVAGRQSPTRNWTRAASHLPKVFGRLVRESLWRRPLRPGATA